LSHSKYCIINSPARGKKKLLKKLLPILIGVKMEAVVFLALAYVGINLIAKKAILISLISIGISGIFWQRGNV
jgi:hypothetical protein